MQPTAACDDRVRRVLLAMEVERAQWDGELHERTLQALAALKIGLSPLRHVEDEAVRGIAQAALDEITAEIARLRASAADLRAPMRDGLGVEGAFRLLVRRAADAGAFVVEPDLRFDGAALDQTAAMAAYRIVQEALANTERHAGARRVKVTVHGLGGELAVEVADDGHGFDAAAASSGFGLMLMRERAQVVGATLRIQSGPAGTAVSAVIPARAAACDAAGTNGHAPRRNGNGL